MFKQKEDREKIDLIEKKSAEIIVIYKKLLRKFIQSLTDEERKIIFF